MVAKIVVFGEKHLIKGDLPDEQLRRVSEMIERKAGRFSEKYKGISKDKILLLVAFEIGEELVILQDECEKNSKKMRQIVKKVEKAEEIC